MMRKPIMSLLLLATFAFTFTNCKKDDKDDPKDTSSYVYIDEAEKKSTSKFDGNILTFTGEGNSPVVLAAFKNRPSSGDYKVIGINPMDLTSIESDLKDLIFESLEGTLDVFIDIYETALDKLEEGDPLYAPLEEAIEGMKDAKDLEAFTAALAPIDFEDYKHLLTQADLLRIAKAAEEIASTDDEPSDDMLTALLKGVLKDAEIGDNEVVLVTIIGQKDIYTLAPDAEEDDAVVTVNGGKVRAKFGSMFLGILGINANGEINFRANLVEK